MMKSNILKVPILLAGLLTLSTVNATAEAPLDGVHNAVIKAAHDSQKGVIMVVSERGHVAADAAYLLAEQLVHNPGYKPLLMVPMDSLLTSLLHELALSKDALPAVIFFNKSGQEVGRVIDAIPSSSIDKSSIEGMSTAATVKS